MDVRDKLPGANRRETDDHAARPWLSIIIPVWNRADTIRRCLDSIFSQTFQDYEVVAVDDGSSDDSVRFMEGYRDGRLRILRHEKNKGSYAARATGIDQARGRWILVVGSDDALCPGALAKINAMIHEVSPDVGVVGLSYQYEDGGLAPAPSFPPGEVGFDEWLRWLDTVCRMDYLACFRREIFDEIEMPSDGRGSQQVTLRIASRYKIRVDPQIGGLVYTDAPNRLTGNKAVLLPRSAKLAHAIESEEVLAEFGPKFRRQAPRYYRNLFFSTGRWYFLAGRRSRGARFMLGYLARKPWAVRGWLALGVGLLGPGAWLWLHRQKGRRA